MADIAALPRTAAELGWHDSFFLLPCEPAMQSLEGVFAAVVETRLPALLVGEEGTGRRSAARAIHRMEAGSDDGLLTFTGAEMNQDVFSTFGVDAAADAMHHTVLIEEVGELDANCQWRLLQFLQGTPAGWRVIAITRKNLEAEVHAGRFREDLFYALNRVSLTLPPLRYRRKDLPGFIDFFLTKYAIVFHRAKPELSTSVRAALVEHSWPGNLTELEGAIRTIVATDDEQLALLALRRSPARRVRNGNGETQSLKQAARAASQHAERELIAKTLTRTQGNRKRAAAELQISYKALLYKLKQSGLGNS
jgi:two-component system, NtrC family, response regulator AtoC